MLGRRLSIYAILISIVFAHQVEAASFAECVITVKKIVKTVKEATLGKKATKPLVEASKPKDLKIDPTFVPVENLFKEVERQKQINELKAKARKDAYANNKDNIQDRLSILRNENSRLERIMRQDDFEKVRLDLITWAQQILDRSSSTEAERLAADRILKFAEQFRGIEVKDFSYFDEVVTSDPFYHLWVALRRPNGKKPKINADFLDEMIHLFRQLEGRERPELPTKERVEEWMARHPSGLEAAVIERRQENKTRIIEVIADRILRGEIRIPKGYLPKNSAAQQAYEKAKNLTGLQPVKPDAPRVTRSELIEKLTKEWDKHGFHFRFAIKSAELLNEMLNNSLSTETMKVLREAEAKGIPFFVNPYYLSLLDVKNAAVASRADLAIREYVIYNKDLVDTFGLIRSWEKEDVVEPGMPNAAGWILPKPEGVVHRRYPTVAILIPQNGSRACAGLCVSCQRFYGFQKGVLNFELDKLAPGKNWKNELKGVMEYFRKDSQLQDILVTGGDALMSSNRDLARTLDAILEMAIQKRKDNETRPDGKKYAELTRVRLGTRLPVYLPQRVNPELIRILTEFKAKAKKAGVQQFVIQTHFESPMEVTPEARKAVADLLGAGWLVTNQHVFTTAASRRGANAKLRQTLNEIGVLTYYTFTDKGDLSVREMTATNIRLVQERVEEKRIGEVPKQYWDAIRDFPLQAENVVQLIRDMREETRLSFLAMDRSVLNLPGIGKSATFETVGLTPDGRRILRFEHDPTRPHTPALEEMGDLFLVEIRSISHYLRALRERGEDIREYDSIWFYDRSETEARYPLYENSEQPYKVTDEITNYGGSPN
jgi:lysine 2,3-aminomutase